MFLYNLLLTTNNLLMFVSSLKLSFNHIESDFLTFAIATKYNSDLTNKSIFQRPIFLTPENPQSEKQSPLRFAVDIYISSVDVRTTKFNQNILVALTINIYKILSRNKIP